MRPKQGMDSCHNIYKLEEKDKATFHSLTNEWIVRAASTTKLEEREFVVDSGASVHMVSKKDLNATELETMRISKNPTTVMTANGEVLTRVEATVYVEELDSFVTVMIFDYTPAVLSLWKFCQDYGSILTTGPSKTTSHPKWQEHLLQFGELRTIRYPWSVDEFFYFIFTNFFYIFIEGYL